MKTPSEYYREDLQSGELVYDPAQEMAVGYLQRVYEELVNHKKPAINLLSKPKVIKGLYLWGGVGVGKTYLMDTFFRSLPFKEKKRIHFHQFMHMIQDELIRLQGEKDPLIKIAKNLSKETRLLCFDEFFVNDIADAMILANLFTALFAHGLTLVATSNVAPDDLYKYGLQRAKFLPAIELIKTHSDVIYLDTVHDYRLRTLTKAGVFFQPNTPDNQEIFAALFDEISHKKLLPDEVLSIEGREIKVKALSHDIVWFEFEALCTVPRSQVDYLDISKHYHTVFLSGVPVIAADDVNTITYFINLIDIFYDANVCLVMLASADIDNLYPMGSLSFEFRRTKSRLIEMQSKEYLHKMHVTI